MSTTVIDCGGYVGLGRPFEVLPKILLSITLNLVSP